MRNNIYKILGAILIVVMIGFYGCDQSLSPDESNTNNEEQTELKNNDPIPGQYIVVMKETNAKGQALSRDQITQRRERLLDVNNIPTDNVIKEYNTALPGFAGKLSDDELQRLRNDPRIKYIEQDKMFVLAPPGACSPWPSCRDEEDGGGSTSQTTPWGISRVGGPVSNSGVAWVIDTGIDLDHPDLNVDTDRSAVFVSRGPGSKSPDDGNGHGSHVAGTIAAIDNGIDVVGVAAGASLVAVKVLDDNGRGAYSDVIDGVDYVAASGSAGDVANMSLGGSTSQAVDDAVKNAASKGIYFAIAAGNDSDDANNYSPARVEVTNVWTVSAIDDTDSFASFSNWSGPTDPPIEFTAPGVDILSTWKDGGTDTISGTSMASPHVAGLLLVTSGSPSTDGLASSDPDGDPDPIAHN